MNRPRSPLTFRIAVGLLVAAGFCIADLPAQETPPPPTPDAPQNNRQQHSQQSARQQKGRSRGIGLGVDLVTTEQGVIVANVREGGPAAKVGLRRGDQIVSFAGQRVSTAEELLNLIPQQQADSTVKAEIRRNGERVDMAIVLGSRENAQDRNLTQQQEQQQQQRQRQQQQQPAPHVRSRTEPQQRRPATDMDRSGERQRTAQYQPPPVWAGFLLERAPLGVIVARLHPEGPARRAGLRVGDRIVRVNGRVTAEPDEVYEAIEQRQPGDQMRLTVLRGEELIEGTLQIEAPPPGVIEQPVDGFGTTPDVARLIEQQRQNTEMIQELLLEVRTLRQELEELRSGRRAAP